MGAIVIIGGHRTGTSLTARLVHELGIPCAPATDRLLVPRVGRERDNPDGYWEDLAFVRLHRRMLLEDQFPCGGWRNPRRDDAIIRRHRDQYRQLICQRAAHSEWWALKDPRLCLLGDVLFDELAALSISTRVITTVRSRSESLSSLQRRGIHSQDAERLESTFELGLGACVALAVERKIPVLPLSLASARTFGEVASQIGRLLEFVEIPARDRPAVRDRLARLVRIQRDVPAPA